MADTSFKKGLQPLMLESLVKSKVRIWIRVTDAESAEKNSGLYPFAHDATPHVIATSAVRQRFLVLSQRTKDRESNPLIKVRSRP